MTDPVSYVFPPLPSAAAMVVDENGRVRVYALPRGDAERLEEMAGPARWEGGDEGIEYAFDMLRAVSSFRATQSFRVTVRRPADG